MKIRLAAFDLDGTLMSDDYVLSSRVRRAVAAAQARGVVVTIATGRMYTSALPYVQDLQIAAPFLACQGGWIQAPNDETILYRVALPYAVARETLILAAAHNWHPVLYADGDIFLQELRHPSDFYEALLGLNYMLLADWETALAAHTPDKIVFVAEPEEIPGMGQILRAALGAHAQIVRSHAKFIEVVPLGVSKGDGLAWLARYLGIPQAEVLAAGDQENDLTMVQWAGIGVAMGNATPELHAVADWIAPPVRADGAAAALERFVLGDA